MNESPHKYGHRSHVLRTSVISRPDWAGADVCGVDLPFGVKLIFHLMREQEAYTNGSPVTGDSHIYYTTTDV